ncbi:MAG TPA: hypothetical protein VK516_06300 [Gemmatimonadaceae bacterium]|jgi:hypothetical protein|nr:hypothetical protein [Gemmatimonadaceae bacterium]
MRFGHIALLVPLLAGCYVYQPVTTASPPTGRPVRLTLTDAGTANLASELGPAVEAIGGKLIDNTADSYVVALSESRKRNGTEIDWRGEQVSISKSLVAGIQQRQFSRARTAVVAGGVIAVLLVARQALWGPGGVFGGGPPGPGPGPK